MNTEFLKDKFIDLKDKFAYFLDFEPKNFNEYLSHTLSNREYEMLNIITGVTKHALTRQLNSTDNMSSEVFSSAYIFLLVKNRNILPPLDFIKKYKVNVFINTEELQALIDYFEEVKSIAV